MTHPTRFLQTILDRPDDDLPRLHYANWLDGCGNPLGEFIRLQCLLAQNPQPQPRHERRAQELLAQHQCFWSHALSGRIEWCSFRRGFIEEIALTDRQLVEHAAELFRYAPVLDLHLEWTGVRLDRLPELPGVQHTLFLDLSSQGLGNGAIERLAEAPLLAQVHGLNLSSNLLEDEGLEAIYDSPHAGNLRELYVSDNPVTDDGVRRLVMAPIVERLEVLDMRFTQVSQEGIDALQRGMRGTVFV
ncbi:MAG: TIGR02996 domain-containing protein [Gemmataceae bacterium]|nr:TIGR02996 domain-containing protein [Gemmataceae bacterium]